MAPRRRAYSIKFKLNVLDKLKTTKLSKIKFCKENSINKRVLNRWIAEESKFRDAPKALKSNMKLRPSKYAEVERKTLESLSNVLDEKRFRKVTITIVLYKFRQLHRELFNADPTEDQEPTQEQEPSQEQEPTQEQEPPQEPAQEPAQEQAPAQEQEPDQEQEPTQEQEPIQEQEPTQEHELVLQAPQELQFLYDQSFDLSHNFSFNESFEILENMAHSIGVQPRILQQAISENFENQEIQDQEIQTQTDQVQEQEPSQDSSENQEPPPIYQSLVRRFLLRSGIITGRRHGEIRSYDMDKALSFKILDSCPELNELYTGIQIKKELRNCTRPVVAIMLTSVVGNLKTSRVEV